MYEIWFCPHYPIARINTASRGVDRTGRDKIRAALAEDIRENGLLNPIVVYNHCPPKYESYYCKQGLNRLAALTSLGWSTAPVIFTGFCDIEDKVPVSWDRLQEYFLDGEIEVYNRTHPSQGPHLKDTVPPETYKYPSVKQWTPVRKGVYRHEDYKSVPVRDDERRRLELLSLSVF